MNATINDSGASCYPSYGLVAIMCNLSKRSVIRIVSELVEMNLVHTHEVKKQDGSFTTNMYFINTKMVYENTHGGSDRRSLGSDTGSLGVVTEDHPLYNNIYFTHHNDPKKINKKKSSSSSLDQKLTEDAKTVLLFLNKKTGKNFKENTKSHLSKIKSRLKDGYTIQDCKTMIVKKCKEWIMTDMDKYLNPQTLFRDANFDKYVAECITQEERQRRLDGK